MVAIQFLFVAATTLFSITIKAHGDTCESVPSLNFVGRDGAGTSNWCGSQQNVCKDLCGGNVQTNECTGGDGGIPIDETEYCYKCVCSDGSIPPLRDYAGSIPGLICLREYQNCIQGSFGNYEGCEEQQCGTGEVSSPGHLSAATYSTVRPSTTQTSFPETNAGVTATTTVLTVTPPESGFVTTTIFSTSSSASSLSSSSSSSASSFSSPSPSSTVFPLASPAIPTASSSSATPTSSSGAAITTTFSGAGVKSTAAWANVAAAGLIGLFVAVW